MTSTQKALHLNPANINFVLTPKISPYITIEIDWSLLRLQLDQYPSVQSSIAVREMVPHLFLQHTFRSNRAKSIQSKAALSRQKWWARCPGMPDVRPPSPLRFETDSVPVSSLLDVKRTRSNEHRRSNPVAIAGLSTVTSSSTVHQTINESKYSTRKTLLSSRLIQKAVPEFLLKASLLLIAHRLLHHIDKRLSTTAPDKYLEAERAIVLLLMLIVCFAAVLEVKGLHHARILARAASITET